MQLAAVSLLLLQALAPWSEGQPPRAYPGPRDVFAVLFREPTKATIGPRASQVKSDTGHIVVRVARGGASYQVILVTDEDESGRVKATYGPYDAS